MRRTRWARWCLLAVEPLSRTRLREMIAAAVKAQSSHNTQPWRFAADGNQVLVFADRTRGLPVNDPGDRELGISCGAAAFTFGVAAQHADLTAAVQRLPDAQDPDLLYRIVLTSADTASGTEAIYGSIDGRHTTRAGFTAEQPAPGLVDGLAGGPPPSTAPGLRRSTEPAVGWSPGSSPRVTRPSSATRSGGVSSPRGCVHPAAATVSRYRASSRRSTVPSLPISISGGVSDVATTTWQSRPRCRRCWAPSTTTSRTGSLPENPSSTCCWWPPHRAFRPASSTSLARSPCYAPGSASPVTRAATPSGVAARSPGQAARRGAPPTGRRSDRPSSVTRTTI